MLLIAEWFLIQGIDIRVISLAIRHQIFSSVLILCDGAKVVPKISFRGVGGLTGSRIAGALARLPILDLVHAHHSKWMKLGFQRSISIAAWIDNLYAAGDTPHKAVSILVEAEEYLKSKWNLSIKPSSRAFLPVQGNRQCFSADGWKHVNTFPCLGHTLEPSGSVDTCFRNVVCACWRALWRNLSKQTTGPLSVSLKMVAFNRSVTPVLSFRLARWPFTTSRAKTLDKLQRRMIRLMCRTPRLSGETDELYNRRAAHAVTDIQHSLVPWGLLWASYIVNWAAHMLRNSAHACWAANLLHFRSSSELDTIRAISSTRRPGTRSEPGFVCKRWTDSVSGAMHFVNNFDVRQRPYANSHRKLSFARARKIVHAAATSSAYVQQHMSRL